MSGLSDKTLTVCKAHWFGHKDSRTCKDCPIMTECHAPCGGGQDALDAWRKRLNEAAEKVKP